MKFAIRPVLCLLVGKKGVCDFWPLRIAGNSDEEIWLVLSCNGYCILKVLYGYFGLPMKDGGRVTSS